MNKILNISVEENLYEEVNHILERQDLDMNIVFSMMLRKIKNRQSIEFLFNNRIIEDRDDNVVERTSQSNTIRQDFNKMTKSKAIRLFMNKGHQFPNNSIISFSSKNKTAYFYWANPGFDVLGRDWYLILNDNINNKLNLCKIPANTLSRNMLVPRADQPQTIDLQIMYNDPTFTDNRSRVSFASLIVDTIQY